MAQFNPHTASPVLQQNNPSIFSLCLNYTPNMAPPNLMNESHPTYGNRVVEPRPTNKSVDRKIIWTFGRGLFWAFLGFYGFFLTVGTWSAPKCYQGHSTEAQKQSIHKMHYNKIYKPFWNILHGETKFRNTHCKRNGKMQLATCVYLQHLSPGRCYLENQIHPSTGGYSNPGDHCRSHRRSRTHEMLGWPPNNRT